MCSVKIAPEELGRMCEGLSLEETGALCKIALGCLASENGRVSVPLSALGVESEKAWQVVSCLALKNRARVAVRWGGSEFYVGTEDMSWQLAQPKPNTVVMAEIPELTERIKKTARTRAMQLARIRRFRGVTDPNVTHQNSVTDPNVTHQNSVTDPNVTHQNSVTDPNVTHDALLPVQDNAPERAPAPARSRAGACAQVRTEVVCTNIVPPLIPPFGGESSSSSAAPWPALDEKTGGPDAGLAKKTARPKKGARVRENSPLMVRIGAWFGRRPSTLWSRTEAERLEAAGPTEDEVALLEDYYRSDDPEIAPYRRRKLETLLNNWTADCDVARQKLGRSGGSSSSASSSSFSAPPSVGDFTVV